MPETSSELPGWYNTASVPTDQRSQLDQIWAQLPLSELHLHPVPSFKFNFTNLTFSFLSRFAFSIWQTDLNCQPFKMEVLLSAHLNDLLNVTFLQVGQKLWNNWTDFLQENYRKCEFIVPDENMRHTLAISHSHRNQNLWIIIQL